MKLDTTELSHIIAALKTYRTALTHFVAVSNTSEGVRESIDKVLSKVRNELNGPCTAADIIEGKPLFEIGFDGTIRETVVNKVFDDGVFKRVALFHNGILRENRFFGDMGIEGDAYDDRPCCLYKTEQGAKNNQERYMKWLKDIP